MSWHTDNDEQRKVSQLDKPFRALLATHQNYENKLAALQSLIDGSDELEPDACSYVYQLVLQLRLNNENVLKNIMRVNKALCLALGLEENASFKKNIDAAISQLGFDNFYGEFSILGHLVDKLGKALARTEQIKRMQQEEKNLFDRLSKKVAVDRDDVIVNSSKYKVKHSKRVETIIAELHSAIGLQSYFSLCLEQLTEAYHAMPGLPKFGILYEYLAGVKGPMAHCFDMTMRGVMLSGSVMQSLANRLGFKPQNNFNHLLHHVNQSLDKLNTEQKALQHDYVTQKKNLEDLANQLESTKKNTVQLEQGWKQSALNLFNR